MRVRIVSFGNRYIRPMNVRCSRAVRLSNKREVFRHHADHALGFERRLRIRMFFPSTRISPLEGASKPGEHFDRGGFSGAVRAQESVERSAFDLQVHLIHGPEVIGIRRAEETGQLSWSRWPDSSTQSSGFSCIWE